MQKEQGDRPAMAFYASCFLARLTLAEAIAFTVERRLAQFGGDEVAAAKSLGVAVAEVRRLAGAGGLFEKVA